LKPIIRTQPGLNPDSAIEIFSTFMLRNPNA
jgi:hypothetical protein